MKVDIFNVTNKTQRDGRHHLIGPPSSQRGEESGHNHSTDNIPVWIELSTSQGDREQTDYHNFHTSHCCSLCVCKCVFPCGWLTEGECSIKLSALCGVGLSSDFLISSQCQCHHQVENQRSLRWTKVKAINRWLQGAKLGQPTQSL